MRFSTISAASMASAVARASMAAAAETHLRRAGSSQRNLEFDFGFDLPFELPSLPCWIPGVSCDNPECPVVQPLDAEDFDLERYIETSWFIQKQQVNPYQSEDQLYCVVATYNQKDDGFIQVQNSGRTGGVDGELQNSDTNSFFAELCANQIEGGELQVAPCLFSVAFDTFAGPYWVLAIGEDYDWAIVSGGAPNVARGTTADGQTLCTTTSSESFLDTNGSGLWLFTKEKVASEATVQAMEDKLTELGIFTGDLKSVEQTGCTYPDYVKV